MSNAPDELKKDIKENHKWALMFIVMCYDFPNIEEPLTKEDFEDPKGKVISLIMYLSSIEPPFYSELNEACRTLDKKKLRKFGPLARCLYQIHITKLDFKRRDSMITFGRGENEKFDSKHLGYFSKCFLLYRGTTMKGTWIKDWDREVITQTENNEI